MEAELSWSQKIAGKIDEHRDMFSERRLKLYRLALLAKVAGRVEALSGDCAKCERLKGDLEGLVSRLGELAAGGQDVPKAYVKDFAAITKHLVKSHKLTCEGDYTSGGLALGMGIGTGVGAMFNELAIGISAGVCLGMVIGALAEMDARKKGRMI